MKVRNMGILGIAVWLSSATLWAKVTTTIPLEKSKANVEFLAVGSPSAIKIRGKAEESKTPLKGSIVLDGNNVSGTAILTLDAFDTGIDKRNEHMKNTYLQIQKFPTSEITLTKMVLPPGSEQENFEAKQVPFEGLLTLHGVKKEIKGLADFKKTGPQVDLSYEFKFPLKDFGIETPSFMGIKVTEDVSINVAVNGAMAKK